MLLVGKKNCFFKCQNWDMKIKWTGSNVLTGLGRVKGEGPIKSSFSCFTYFD